MEAMANLTLVYGMRLLPADEVAEVSDAPIKLKNGNEARVTMHVLEGSREAIEAQLKIFVLSTRLRGESRSQSLCRGAGHAMD